MEAAMPLWQLRRQTVLATLVALDESNQPMLVITCGLGLDFPMQAPAYERCNRENAQLMFGRIFMTGNEETRLGAILLQDFLPMHGITWESQPSIQLVVTLIGSITARGEAIAPGLITDLGGRPFRDDEGFLLAAMG